VKEQIMAKENAVAKKQAKPGSQIKFDDAGFFVLRAPLLPLAEFLVWSAGTSAATVLHDEAALAQALTTDRGLLRERLRALVAQPEISDAIFVASPDLDEYVEHWRREPESKRGARVEGALVRYFTRMCSRATPFGLFAATALGQIGATTDLQVATRQRCERHTRLDMDYLFALVNTLVKDRALQRALPYRPNNSLYNTADRLRYVEARLSGKRRSYHLVAVEQTEYLTTTLERAAAGATLTELAAALVDEEITQAEAEGFIEQLIENQILVPDLALPITGAEPIHPVIAKLRSTTLESAAATVLEQVRDELAALDAAGLGVTPQQYQTIAEKLNSLPAKVELPRLFQVDLVRPANEATLSTAVVEEISAGAELLRSLFGGTYEDELSRFREAFSKRYEEREVSLVEALDDDLGIGFPVGGQANGHAPLLNGLALPGGGDAHSQWRQRESYLLEKLAETWAAGRTELTLTDKDIEALKLKEPLPWMDTFSALCKLAAPSPAALAQGDFQVLLESAGGASGANLLGRFCHADAALQAEVERYLRAEEAHQPEAVFAEIAHLPEGRIGNILARPVLRDYEIPYLGASGAASERQLPVTDLLVSVRAGRVVLRSARLGCEVIPRLTSAHNWGYERASVYKFLCALQTQNRLPGVAWNWGALESAPFLPRVTFGRLVLAQARWLVSKEELQKLNAASAQARFQAVQQWRAARKLPRYVVLADDDNTLPIDLENTLSVDAFIQIVKERSRAVLRELWPAPEQLCARGAEGAFVHELIVPFIRKDEGGRMKDEAENRQSFHPSSLILHPSKRSFAPGSEWLYAKLYCGTATADQVLREVVQPVAQRIIAAGAADHWYFVRYSDPDHHLRLRFQGEPGRLLTQVWPQVQAALAPLLAEGRVWRVQLDTYEREVERYGGAAGIGLAERLFYADSVAVAELLELSDTGDAGMDERWRLALCGIDRLLTDLGFDAAGKLEFFQRARKNFLAEFRADENLNEQLSERYRQERKRLEALLDSQRAAESELAPGLEVLERRSQRIAPIAAALRTAEREGRLTQPLSELAWSYAHMHVNRLLRSAQRQQEMVLYDLLTRLYSAQAARQRQPQVAQALAA
jgi:lantibiotic biosynthesis protein